MKKKLKIVIIIFASFLLFGAIAYTARGWLRGSVIPSYVSVVYKSAMEKDFNSNFSMVNSKLSNFGSFGFSFAQPSLDGCDADPQYEGFSETVACEKVQDNVPLALTPKLAAQWQNTSAGFEKYLESNGWKLQYDAHQSISSLFSVNRDNPTPEVDYIKSHGKTNCYLAIRYDAVSGESGFNQIDVEESCERDVSFFGGI